MTWTSPTPGLSAPSFGTATTHAGPSSLFTASMRAFGGLRGSASPSPPRRTFPRWPGAGSRAKVKCGRPSTGRLRSGAVCVRYVWTGMELTLRPLEGEPGVWAYVRVSPFGGAHRAAGLTFSFDSLTGWAFARLCSGGKHTETTPSACGWMLSVQTGMEPKRLPESSSTTRETSALGRGGP